MILISACLLGRNVKYSGGNNLCPWLAKYYNTEDFTAFCPECLAMLPIPRPPVEIQNGSGEDVLNGKACVKDKTGLDVTREFLSGAQRALQIAKHTKSPPKNKTDRRQLRQLNGTQPALRLRRNLRRHLQRRQKMRQRRGSRAFNAAWH